MVTTPMVGSPDALVLYSGDANAFAEHRDTLAALGGEVELLGDDPGLAAVHDIGMLDVFFTGMTAFLHAAAIVGADGVPAQASTPLARRMLVLLNSMFEQLARDVDAGEFPGDEDTLAMELVAIEHIVEASRAWNVDPSAPEEMRDLVATAVNAGTARTAFAVVTVLRGRS